MGEDEGEHDAAFFSVLGSRLHLVHPLTSPRPLCTHSCHAEYLRTLPTGRVGLSPLCVCEH